MAADEAGRSGDEIVHALSLLESLSACGLSYHFSERMTDGAGERFGGRFRKK
jgi:hypothetical protein